MKTATDHTIQRRPDPGAGRSLRRSGWAAILGATLVASTSLPAGAADTVTTGQSWNGGAFAYPPGAAEITHVVLELDGSTPVPFHCHPVPTMAYILDGEITVETLDGQRRTFVTGERMVEVMNTVHRGIVERPVRLVIFYAGAEGIPNTVLADSDQAAEYCKP